MDMRRKNVELVKLASLIMALEDALEAVDNPSEMVYWERLHRRCKVWEEELNDYFVLNTLDKVAWNKGDFNSFNEYGNRVMGNFKEIYGELVNPLVVHMRILVVEIRHLSSQIFNGKRENISSKKKLLRMIRDNYNTDFDTAYGHPEWFYVQHCKPINEVLQFDLHYINDLTWRF